MHKIVYSLAAVAAALSFGAPAAAQDEVDAASAAAQDEVNDGASDDRGWNGVYFGGRLGYTTQHKDNQEQVLFDNDGNGVFGDVVRTAAGADAFSPGFCGGRALASAPVTAFGNRGVCQDDGDGTEYAAHVGADAQFGPLVAGVVVEYGRASGVNDSVSAFSTTPAFYTLTRSLRDHASARGRLGFASGNTLFYGTGGVAYGKLRYSQTTSNTVNSFTLNRTKDDTYGYVFGGGIEQKTGRNFSVGLQYLYTNLEDDDFRLQVGALASTPTTNPFIRINRNGTSFQRTGERFGRHNLGVTANFRF